MEQRKTLGVVHGANQRDPKAQLGKNPGEPGAAEGPSVVEQRSGPPIILATLGGILAGVVGTEGQVVLGIATFRIDRLMTSVFRFVTWHPIARLRSGNVEGGLEIHQPNFGTLGVFKRLDSHSLRGT